MGIKSFLWGAVEIATLGIVQEWHHYVLIWDDGEEEHVWAGSIENAIWKLDYSIQTAKDHLVSWCRLDENGNPTDLD